MQVGLTYTARTVNRPAAAIAVRSNGHVDDAEEEFDSPQTIAAIADALRTLGHEVELLGDGAPLARRLLSGPKPDLVFNIAEGRGISRCREAWAPALLEMFGIAYTGSDPLTMTTTLDKHTAKRLVRGAGVAVPEGVVVDGPLEQFSEQLAALSLPVIVKPAFEGSSKGIRQENLVQDRCDLHKMIARCGGSYHQGVLVEKYIDGAELTVGIIGNRLPEVIGIMRVVPVKNSEPFVYGLDVKRNWRQQVRYEIPARLDAADDAAVRSSALTAYHALGCRDVARIDFRLRDGVPYFLEANPLPGLVPGSSDLVLLAEGVGIGYGQLIRRIVDAALGRLSPDRSFLPLNAASSSV